MKETVLIIGANGQLGTEITAALRTKLSEDAVICSDLSPNAHPLNANGPYEQLDIRDGNRMLEVINKYKVTQIYHLAALLSATGEKMPDLAWEVNMNGYRNLLNIAKENKQIAKIYFPSSIAVFGPSTPRVNTPQAVVCEPTTMYGLTKYSGELLSQYYNLKYGVDIRSLRYPGIISYKTPPGGGTTDYAVDIYHKALETSNFECFLSENTSLPMMYIDDALNATFQLMEAPSEQIKVRTSYNLAAVSFTPAEQAKSIQKEIPDFKINYQPDFRQAIADSWPDSIDDSAARNDWHWQHKFNLDDITHAMLSNLKELKGLAIL